MKNPIHRLRLLLAATVLALSGCGGAGNEDATSPVASRSASARFSIVWPDATKLVPIAAKAVQIDVLQGSTKVATKVAARGAAGSTTVIDMENLPAGKLTFEASALPNVDLSGSSPTASGVPQAKGSAPLTTEPGKTAKITITMASTIERLAIFPNPWQLEKLKPSVPARATAYDAQNRVVLTDPDRQFTWSSSNTGIVDVSANSGAVNANEKGFATLTVRDRESGKSATSQVEVVDEVPIDRVVVAPATATVAPGATVALIATALDKEGNDLEYTSDKFDWTSSDPTKATVDATGIVAGLVEGSATIEIKERVTGKTATAQILVAAEETGDPLVYVNVSSGDRPYRRLVSSTQIVPITMPYEFIDFGSRIGRRVFYRTFADQEATWYSAKDDGTDRREIYTYNDDHFISLRSNADGTRVLILETDSYNFPDGTREFFEIDTATGAKTAWTMPTGVRAGWSLVAWSPAGDRCVMQSPGQGDAGFEIGLFNRAGQRLALLPSKNAHFSLDGELVAVTDRLINPTSPSILVYSKDGSVVARPSSLNSPTLVRFHPTKKKLIYLDHDRTSGNDRYIEMDVDGSNKRVYYDDPEFLGLPYLRMDSDDPAF